LALAYAGISLLAGGRWPVVFLPGVLWAIDRGVIVREEAYLQEHFGPPYRDYRSRVRRWL
jgi:protein-S-isoprenylcysteine O-methyltransferase Ste14